MRYFDLYEMAPAFLIDEEALKQRYYELSRTYHPDFYTLESAEKQAEVLELSTLYNNAYRVLSDFDRRMHYLLSEKGVLKEEGKNDLPQSFLLEMMDVNEALMELEMDFDGDRLGTIQEELHLLNEELRADVQVHLVSFDSGEGDDLAALEAIKSYYFKRRYLLRIHENLNKFANP